MRTCTTPVLTGSYIYIGCGGMDGCFWNENNSAIFTGADNIVIVSLTFYKISKLKIKFFKILYTSRKSIQLKYIYIYYH